MSYNSCRICCKGNRGPVGKSGLRGPVGDAGPRGYLGPQGPIGAQGPAGKDGDTGEQGPPGRDGVDGVDGKDGEQGVQGPQGSAGRDGVDGVDGKDGATGAQGPQGSAGKDGLDGVDGLDGKDGATGDRGPTGNTGLQGPPGKDGDAVAGIVGPTGATGRDGPPGRDGVDGKNGATGATGLPGSSAAIDSVFVWSSQQQSPKNITTFQYITFNQPLTGPTGYGWVSSTASGYSAKTNFKCMKSGWYLLTYKVDVRSGAENAPTDRTDSATCLLVNGVDIPGSTTVVEAPADRHHYVLSNTILCQLSVNDIIQLAFWCSDMDGHVGDTSILGTYQPVLPGTNTVPTEASASLVLSRIST
jgi:hypothetical protein